IGEMQKEADKFSAVAVWCENRTQQIRNVHSGQADALAAGQNRCEHDRADEPPEQPAGPVHNFRSNSCARFSLSRNESAALIRPRWVNPCGKFPSASPLSGSISSARRSTLLAYPSAASKTSAASERFPLSARKSASQKLQTAKAPS